MKVGVDLLGSDRSPENLIDASILALNRLDPQVSLVLLGFSHVLDQARSRIDSSRCHYLAVDEEITMDESPLLAIRRKKKASLAVGIEQLGKSFDAFVTTGNTGALIGLSTLKLPLLPGISRPGLLASLPTTKGRVAVIDIGGNVNPKPQYLWQYAKVGAAYQMSIGKITHPKIGLLNIGTEPIKGTRGVQEAYRVLEEEIKKRSDALEFVGNVEGRDAFNGSVDVLVCGGFAGNIFLKTAEGISSFILDYLKSAVGGERLEKVTQALDTLSRHFHYAEYPGAFVGGVDGVVVKCHGFSSSEAVANGIIGAARLVQGKLIEEMRDILTRWEL